MSDDHWYTGLLNKLNVIQPAQIIVPQTIFDAKPETADGKLIKYLREQFPMFPVIKIPRRNFSDTDGNQFINKYCSKKFNHVIQLISSKYYALSAVAGLMKYLLHSVHVNFRENSLKLEFDTKYGHLLMGKCEQYSSEFVVRHRIRFTIFSIFETSKRPTRWSCWAVAVAIEWKIFICHCTTYWISASHRLGSERCAQKFWNLRAMYRTSNGISNASPNSIPESTSNWNHCSPAYWNNSITWSVCTNWRWWCRKTTTFARPKCWSIKPFSCERVCNWCRCCGPNWNRCSRTWFRTSLMHYRTNATNWCWTLSIRCSIRSWLCFAATAAANWRNASIVYSRANVKSSICCATSTPSWLVNCKVSESHLLRFPNDQRFRCLFAFHSIDYVTNLSSRCGQAFKMHYDVTHGYHVRLMVAPNTSKNDFPPEFNVVSSLQSDSSIFNWYFITNFIFSFLLLINACSCRWNGICAVWRRVKSTNWTFDWSPSPKRLQCKAMCEFLMIFSRRKDQIWFFLLFRKRVLAFMLSEIVTEIDTIYDLSGFVATLDNLVSLASVGVE